MTSESASELTVYFLAQDSQSQICMFKVTIASKIFVEKKPLEFKKQQTYSALYCDSQSVADILFVSCVDSDNKLTTKILYIPNNYSCLATVSVKM